MNYFRRIGRPTLLLWSLLLSMALLCAQGASLHVHSLDHEHGDHYFDHTHEVGEDANHSHLSKAHFTHDASHDYHHDVVSEIDISPDGVWKNINNGIFSIALLILFFTLMRRISSRHLVQRYREIRLIPHSYYLLSPPLRAPPQH